MGALIEWRPEHLGDGSQHALKVRKNFIVPEPQHTPPFPLEFAVAQVVVAGARMLAAIDFDDQAGLNACEIDDVGWNGKLTSKSPAELIVAKFFPQRTLGMGHITA